MRTRRLGDSDLQVSEISLGSWLTYSGRRRGGRDRRVHPRRVRRRHQLLRHRQRLRARRRRGGLGRDPRRLPARGLRARDEGLLPDVRHRPRALARADRTSRSTPRWRGCRPTTSTSTSATASTRTSDRGHDGGADRGRPRRQGPLPGLQRVDARSRSAPASRSRARRSSSPPSRSTRCSGARRRPRCSGSAPSNGISKIVWSPLAEGVLTGKYRPASRRPSTRAPPATRWAASSSTAHRRDARGRAAPRARSPTAPGSRCRRSRSPGSCAAPSSRRRSSARRRPEQVHPTSPRRGRAHRRHPGGDRRGARRRPAHRPGPAARGDARGQAPLGQRETAAKARRRRGVQCRPWNVSRSEVVAEVAVVAPAEAAEHGREALGRSRGSRERGRPSRRSQAD